MRQSRPVNYAAAQGSAEQTAARAFAQASRRCTADCAWYHGLWPYLRLLGLTSTPLDNTAFYRRELRRLSAGARVLVAATADAAPLELLGAAPGLSVTVVDRCATPLWLCEEHAARTGTVIATVQADVRTWRPAEPFDAVFTHGLLARFAPPGQAEVIAAWRDCLAPGGRLLLVTRVDADPATQGAGFAAPGDLVAAVQHGLRTRGIDDAGISAAAAVFAARFTRHAPLSRPLVEAALHAAGLRVEASADRLHPTTPGLDGAGRPPRRYAEIVAVRP